MLLRAAALVLLTACLDTGLPPQPPALPTISLTPSDTSLTSGGTVQMTAVIRDAGGHVLTGRPITWSSTDSTIARPSAAGVASPSTATIASSRAGRATIVASSEGVAGQATITVISGPAATIAVAPSGSEITADATIQLSALVSDAAGNVVDGRPVSWSSSNPAVATVDSTSGLVQGRGSGTVNISATLGQLSASASLSVIGAIAGVSATDIGALVSADRASIATAINNSGQVVGSTSLTDAPTHGFVWSAAGGAIDLGSNTSATSINDRGQVVGGQPGIQNGHAFRWSQGAGMQDLGVLPGGHTSAAFGINTGGDVVGTSETQGGTLHAFIWTESGGSRDLGVMSGDNASVAYAIDDGGQVVGESSWTDIGYCYSSGPCGTTRAFLWTADSGFVDLHAGTSSAAYGVSAAGAVGARDQHAFRWSAAGGLDDLGSIGADGRQYIAYAVNREGQIVVGERVAIDYYGQGAVHAFIWTPGTGMQLLANAESGARGINDHGQVVGWFRDPSSGATHAVLWTLPSTLAQSRVPASMHVARGHPSRHRP